MSAGLVSEHGGEVAQLSKTRCKTLSSQPQKFHTAIAQTILNCTANLITERQRQRSVNSALLQFDSFAALVVWGGSASEVGHFWGSYLVYCCNFVTQTQACFGEVSCPFCDKSR